MDKTSARLFAGGDGFGVGARAAGLRSLWGVEIDPAIAAWATANDPDLQMIVSDVSAVDYAALERPWHLHASPSCKNASQANQDANEAGEDVAAAEATAKAITALQPVCFTLENVWAYRNFEAFCIILRALSENGYKADFWHLNAADYGVPQSRRRLILIARRDRWPVKPTPTHTDPASIPQQASLFDTGLRPWVGWYEAIEDLVPTLPPSQFAKWQLERLPALDQTVLIDKQHAQPAGTPNHTLRMVTVGVPSFPIVVERVQNTRAFIADSCWSCGNCDNEWQAPDKPACCPFCGGDDIGWNGGEPAPPVTTQFNGRARAFIVDGKLSTSGDKKILQISDAESPYGTVVSSHSAFRDTRAWLVESRNIQEWSDGLRDVTEPAMTVNTSTRPAHWPKAWLSSGRVVSLTPRALARLQTFPDDYALPENNGLACTIIGNAVPCLLARRICESVLEAGNV